MKSALSESKDIAKVFNIELQNRTFFSSSQKKELSLEESVKVFSELICDDPSLEGIGISYEPYSKRL